MNHILSFWCFRLIFEKKYFFRFFSRIFCKFVRHNFANFYPCWKNRVNSQIVFHKFLKFHKLLIHILQIFEVCFTKVWTTFYKILTSDFRNLWSTFYELWTHILKNVLTFHIRFSGYTTHRRHKLARRSRTKLYNGNSMSKNRYENISKIQFLKQLTNLIVLRFARIPGRHRNRCISPMGSSKVSRIPCWNGQSSEI